jgi:hypothetical protein
MRFGFVGPAYASQSPLADAEALINWYPEQMESPNARVAWALYPTPGLSLFATLAPGLPSVRGFCTVSGRTFAVGGTHLYELSGSGGVTDYGGFGGNNFIVDDGLPAIMVAGGTSGGSYPGQVLIASGGTVTVFDLPSNTFKAITAAPTNVLMVDFLDGFFIALSSGNTWQVSAAEDCTTWTGLAITQVSVFSDQLLSVIASNRLLWVFGARRAVAYYNSGAPIFPFAVVNGGFLEVGILAQFSVAQVATVAGTTVMWLGGDERGANVVFAANGFTPQRVSDHALEYFMSKQTNTADAVGWATQEQGHNFYWLWFPTADATWRLDADNGKWHRMSSLVAGRAGAHLARCHTYNFGRHLVGDRTSGNVYSMDIKFLNENTGVGVFTPIIRTRIGPTISEEGGAIPVPINEFQVDFEVGLGPQPPLLDAFGLPRDPYAMFSYSEDFGKTWTPERMIACGQAGNFQIPAVDRRLGSWRSWTPKVTVSDPIPWRIVDAYVNGTQEKAPRLAKSFAKIS